MIDSYRWGHVERQSPEADVPIVNLQKRRQIRRRRKCSFKY